MRAAVDPHASFGGERLVEIRPRLSPTPKGSARGAAFIPPQRALTEHPRTCVVREPCQALAEKTFGVRGPSRPEARRPALEPHQSVSWKPFAERRQQLQRVVVTTLAVVEQQQRE